MADAAGGTGAARSERRSELPSRTWGRFSIQPSRLSPAPGSRRSRPHTATTCPRARRAGGRCRGRCRRRRDYWFNPASSGVRGCERSRTADLRAARRSADRTGRRAADRLAGPRGSRDSAGAWRDCGNVRFAALARRPRRVVAAPRPRRRDLRRREAASPSQGVACRHPGTARADRHCAHHLRCGRRAIAPFPRLRHLRGPVGQSICRRAPHDLVTPGGRADCSAVGSAAADPLAPGSAVRAGASGPLDHLRQRQRHCGL